MKILIVASYNKNRFAPFVLEQADALMANSCSIEWFGITKKGIWGYLLELPRLRQTIQEIHPDCIHAHYGLSGLLATLASRKTPVVVTYHGSDINKKLILPFSKVAMKLAAWNVFVSKRTMDIALGSKQKKKASLIPCGVDICDDQLQSRVKARNALGWNDKDKKVLFAGSFDNGVKQPWLAKHVVEQASILSNEKIELMELKGYSRKQVNQLLCASNCLLMTSRTEGSPQIIKEALACGCPIVSVDVGDVYERIVGVDGCYVVNENGDNMLPKLVETLLQALAFNGRTNGRQRIIDQQLTNQQVAQRLIAIYQQIIDNNY